MHPMPQIDWARASTDDLLAVMPEIETAEWEFKDAKVFEKEHFGQWKSQDIGKIVSSFANSGGGYLVLGRRDGEPAFDPVPREFGRTPLEDHLSLVISQSVTPHCRDFSMRRVPISGSGDSILVVAFSDSIAAPHQSNALTQYFYRLPGHAVPAPHFHLELLRSRLTRASLAVQGIEQVDASPIEDAGAATVHFVLRATVENTSAQAASPWGLHVRNADVDFRWSVGMSQSLARGLCVRGEPAELLPGELGVVRLDIVGRAYGNGASESALQRDLVDSFAIVLAPVSHNFSGQRVEYALSHRDRVHIAGHRGE
jgi:hypothetical protein